MTAIPSIGLDFGTTNSSAAFRDKDGVRLARFEHSRGVTESFRSLIYFDQERTLGRSKTIPWTGPGGIDRYLAAEPKGRLMQSLKSFLASRLFEATEVFGKLYTIEELIAVIVRDIRLAAQRQFGFAPTKATVGRPVRFVGAETPEDDQFAIARLRSALQKAGFEEIHFEYEPAGAAYHYEASLDHDELILIGDFGGGTSDFSLLRVGPSARTAAGAERKLIGNAGVGVAGDAFDARIVRHVVSPQLGAGGSMKSVDKILPVPGWVYAKLERWHHLSFLRSKDVLNMLRSVRAMALEPTKIASLLDLIESERGYELHRAVQEAKCALSAHESAIFRFDDAGIEIETPVRRKDFETWIEPELALIEGCVDGLLRQAGIAAESVDRVFLTGGSSFVPAVRRIFESRFGGDRLSAGNEFTSVARGLALAACNS